MYEFLLTIDPPLDSTALMLRQLIIENIVVIERLELDFAKGFHIFTGETGAGKSILVESIGLILGNKAKLGLIRDGCDKATVEAVFEWEPDSTIQHLLDENELTDSDNPHELVIRRVLSRDGRNMIFVNHRRTSLQMLQLLTKNLIDFTGQHDAIELLDSQQDQKILDSFLENRSVLEEYQKLYAELQIWVLKCEELEKKSLEKDERLEWIRHQLKEIEGLQIRSSDDEVTCLEQRQKLKNAAIMTRFAESVDVALTGADGVQTGLGRLQREFEKNQNLAEIFPDFLEKLRAAKAVVEDLGFGVAQKMRGIPHDAAAEIEKIEAKLYKLERLKAKFGPTLNDILNREENLLAEQNILSHLEDNLQALCEKRAVCLEHVKKSAAKLTQLRLKAASELEKSVAQELTDLQMAGARFAVEITTASKNASWQEYGPLGADRVRFLLSANPGMALKPLAEVASGGETSRIFLAIKKVLQSQQQVATLIFDEIDAGVSGAAVEMTGRKLKDLAKGRQVFCITHSPLIAALADRHFHVEKSRQKNSTITRVKMLGNEERVMEIARLLGGTQMTPRTVSHAREMVNRAQNLKTPVA